MEKALSYFKETEALQIKHHKEEMLIKLYGNIRVDYLQLVLNDK